jgi:hypothetical protein
VQRRLSWNEIELYLGKNDRAVRLGEVEQRNFAAERERNQTASTSDFV